MSDDYSDPHTNPYWDMMGAVSSIGPYFRCVRDMMLKYPDPDTRTIYRIEYKIEAPDPEDPDQEGLGVWCISFGPMLQAYLEGRVEQHSLNTEVEISRAQEAIREHMFRFIMMEKMQGDPENVFMIPVERDEND